MEVKEIKDALDGLHRDFQNEFKQYTDRAEREQKAHGETLAETKSTLEKINERQDALEVKLSRVHVGQASLSGDLKEMSEEARQKSAAFKSYVQKGRSGMSPEERKALVQDAAGEIIVPEEFESQLYRDLPRPTNMRGMAIRQTTSSNRVRRATMGELSVGWGKLETNDQNLADSMGVPGEEYIYVEDLYGLAKIGEDELMDSSFNLENYVRSSFMQAIDLAEDTAFVAGTGHANNQPGGILTEVPAYNAGYETETAAASAITFEDIIDLKYALPEQYTAGAGFIVKNQTKGALRKLREGDSGQFLWTPNVAAGAPPTLDGDPVYTNGAMPAIADGNQAVVYGNVSYGYKVVDRLGMTIQRLNELYAEDGLVGFKVHFRVGGGVVRPKAFRILKVKAAA